MKKLLTCLLLLLGFISKAQNLVHNPSFEQNINCPYDSGQLGYATEWFGTGDYFDSCCNNCSVDIPANYVGYRSAYINGHAYSGFFTYKKFAANYRTYIGGAIDALIPGHWYRVKLYVSCPSKMKYTTAGPAVFFYINQTIPATTQVLPFIPQINYYFNYTDVADTTNWLVRENIFYADSAYNKLLIGNFLDDDSAFVYTSPIQIVHTYDGAYNYLDNISVIDITATYLAGLEQRQQIVSVYPNPFTDNTTLSFNNPQSKLHTLAVYNMQGVLVRVINNITANEIVLHREGLPAAYYFYRLSNNNTTVATGKLLIQ